MRLLNLKLDANEVYPNIWVGSHPNETSQELNKFSLLVLCAEECQPIDSEIKHFKGRIFRPAFKDSNYISTNDNTRITLSITEIVQTVNNGKKVLITCAAGLNRSAFVAGLSILQLVPTLSANDVIEMIRKKRSHPMALGAVALGNKLFCELLYKVADSRV